MSPHGRHWNRNLKNFSQNPFEDKERKQRHEAVGQDQDGNRVHTSADGVLEVEHEVGDTVDSSMEEVGQLFKDCLVLAAVLHSLIELAGTVLRLLDGLINICCKIGCHDVGNMRAAGNDEGHSQTKNTKADGQPFQKVLFSSDEQYSHGTSRWNKDQKRQFYSVLDQKLFQEQDHEDGDEIDVHIRQAVRQGGSEVVRQCGNRQRGGKSGRREFHHSVTAFLYAFKRFLNKACLRKYGCSRKKRKCGYEDQR